MKKTTLIGLLLLLGLRLWAQEEVSPTVEFYPHGGFFDTEVEVSLRASGATIYYTLDGSMPTRQANIYKKPLKISQTTVLRAIAYRDGKPGRPMGYTYFIQEPATALPVVSIGIKPSVLFDPVRGLFMQGTQLADTSWKMPGANFWSRQEVPVQVEIFDSNGQCIYNSRSGLRLFGGMSRLFPQKSLSIVARERYGAKRIEYPIFGEKGPKSLKFLVLRNSGSDWGKTHFRDALMTGLLDRWDIDKQAYRPAHVYINGKYWGIYNLREKINRYFIAEHHKGVHKDSIDFLEHNMLRRRGSASHYRRMLDFIANNSLRDSANYARLQTMMDVDNFMNYQIAQIYFDNQDAGGNIKYWRPRTPDGRWRWILYDTDWGFGLHERYAYKNNSLAFHTEPNGPAWPNPPWSTFLLRKLLESPQFEQKFITRFADHLNTTFEPQHVEAKIEEIYRTLLPEMPRHLQRWSLDEATWHKEVNRLRVFARERPYYMRLHLMDRFNAGGLRYLEVSVEGGGAVLVNDHIEVDGWQLFAGEYFANLPVSLKVLPRNGYRFVRWEGLEENERQLELELKLTERQTFVKAVFEKFEHPLAGKVIINEISANNRQSGDWVEIFNNTKQTINLHGWILSDRSHNFKFPEITIAPKDYLVVCQDRRRFYTAFPAAYNVVGEMSFGLNKYRETLQLFSALGEVVDSVSYDLPPTDFVFTLNLLLPTLDNSDPENWEMRSGVGTPNAPNPYFLESSIRIRQKEWLEIGIAASIVILCVAVLILRHRKIL